MFDVGRVGWIFILRGVFALLFALVLFVNPGLSLMTLVFAFGLYAIADGVFALGTAFRHSDEGEQPWWALFVVGFASLFAGWISLFLFNTSAMWFAFLIAAWALVKGAMSIMAAFYLRKHLAEEWMLAASGVFSVIFGAAMALLPSIGALAMVAWIGGYSLIYGVLLIALGAKLRSWMKPGYAEFEHRYSEAVTHYIH